MRLSGSLPRPWPTTRGKVRYDVEPACLELPSQHQVVLRSGAGLKRCRLLDVVWLDHEVRL